MELTINKVNHGRDCAIVDLIVVDDIQVSRDKTAGEILATSGRQRVWTNWSPADEALLARKCGAVIKRSSVRFRRRWPPRSASSRTRSK